MAQQVRKFQVRLHDTDAAGILFFARELYFAHDVYEDFLRAIGFPMERLLGASEFFVPIVHAEAQFQRNVRAGDTVTIALQVAAVGTTSYTLSYELTNTKSEIVGTAKTVHVSVSRATGGKIPLPAPFRAAITAFRDRA